MRLCTVDIEYHMFVRSECWWSNHDVGRWLYTHMRNDHYSRLLFIDRQNIMLLGMVRQNSSMFPNATHDMYSERCSWLNSVVDSVQKSRAVAFVIYVSQSLFPIPTLLCCHFGPFASIFSLNIPLLGWHNSFKCRHMLGNKVGCLTSTATSCCCLKIYDRHSDPDSWWAGDLHSELSTCWRISIPKLAGQWLTTSATKTI